MSEIVATTKFLILNYLHEVVCKNRDIAHKEALRSLNLYCQKCLRFNLFLICLAFDMDLKRLQTQQTL